MQDVNLPLRSIHETQSVPWWPLAPGWWMLIAGVILLVLVYRFWRRRERARVARVHAFFDADVAHAKTDAERVARISELLRRSSRMHVKGSDKLEGDAWLNVLNRKLKHRPFQGELGALLLEGGFRRQVNPDDVNRLQQIARDRFAKWVRNV